MIVAVASLNEAKINAVREALSHLSTQVFGIECSSGVSPQPMNEEETMKGAMNRARIASQQADYGVGIESGLSMINGRTFESGWVCVVTKEGQVGLASSNRYEIRKPVLELIEQGLELSEAIEQLTGLSDIKTQKGMSGVITNGIINRSDSYRDAVLLAFAPFLSDQRLWK